MTNYTKTTDFAAKDSLPSGDSGKIIRGTEFETEFDNIATAVNSKSDANNPTFTGTVTIDGLTVNGNTVLGNAATDTVTVTADIASNLLPSADDTYNLGAVGAEWNDLFIDGVANIDSLVANTADINGGTVDGVTIGGSSAGAITGTTITGTGFVTSGNMSFGDGDRAVFGAGSDLQIYHDGSASRIVDNGPGDLYIQATDQLRITNSSASESYLIANENSGVTVYYDNAPKLATTSTGIDVSGTVSADGLTVDGEGRIEETGAAARFIVSRTDALNVAETASIDLLEGSAGGSFGSANNYGFSIDLDGSDNTLNVLSGNQTTVTKRLSVDRDTGNISFFEDTGTTAKFRWDSSAERLGIGTTLPNSVIESASTSDGGDVEAIRLTNSTTTANSSSSIMFNISTADVDSAKISSTRIDGSNNDLRFSQRRGGALTEAMRITSAGLVGIGTDSPATTLTVEGSSANGIELNRNGADAASSARLFFDSSTNCSALFNSGGNFVIATGATPSSSSGTERMRITSSGTALVGKTSSASSTVGAELRQNGLIIATTSSVPSLTLNRTTSDGAIAEFRKDNTTVGSIGTRGGDVYLETGDTGIRMYDQYDAIIPVGSAGISRDAAIDLGLSNIRFKDLYLSGGAYLGGTAAANKLDDYEEGTWTPVASVYDGTLTVNSATYTKIGDSVTLRASVSFDATVDSSGISFTGLPFTHTGESAGNGGFVTRSTVTSATRLRGLGVGTISLRDTADANVAYTTLASTTLEFVFVYRTTS